MVASVGVVAVGEVMVPPPASAAPVALGFMGLFFGTTIAVHSLSDRRLARLGRWMLRMRGVSWWGVLVVAVVGSSLGLVYAAQLIAGGGAGWTSFLLAAAIWVTSGVVVGMLHPISPPMLSPHLARNGVFFARWADVAGAAVAIAAIASLALSARVSFGPAWFVEVLPLGVIVTIAAATFARRRSLDAIRRGLMARLVSVSVAADAALTAGLSGGERADRVAELVHRLRDLRDACDDESPAPVVLLAGSRRASAEIRVVFDDAVERLRGVDQTFAARPVDELASLDAATPAQLTRLVGRFADELHERLTSGPFRGGSGTVARGRVW